jgi:hypothetical protein
LPWRNEMELMHISISHKCTYNKYNIHICTHTPQLIDRPLLLCPLLPNFCLHIIGVVWMGIGNLNERQSLIFPRREACGRKFADGSLRTESCGPIYKKKMFFSNTQSGEGEFIQ